MHGRMARALKGRPRDARLLPVHGRPMISPATVLVLCRISFYAAASVLYGRGCFVAFLAPPRLGQEISSPFRTAGVVPLLATLPCFPTHAPVIGDGCTSALPR